MLEFERYHASNVKDSEGASGGKVVDFKQYSAAEQIIDMVFDIEKAGDYTLVRGGWVMDFAEPYEILSLWSTGINDAQLGAV